jgi:hypothetical protein
LPPNKSVLYNFENVYSCTDIEYGFSGEQLKENIILNAPLSEPSIENAYFSIEMNVEISEGLQSNVMLERGDDYRSSEEIEFYRGDTLAFTLAEPYAIDANGDIMACDYVFSHNILKVQCSYEWLKDAAYPVKIDPTILPNQVLTERMGTSVSTGDFNADGFEDALVGAPYF